MCSKFCVDSPYTLAVGGNKNGFHIINILKLLDGEYVFTSVKTVLRLCQDCVKTVVLYCVEPGQY